MAVTEPRFEFPESSSKFPLAVCFTCGNGHASLLRSPFPHSVLPLHPCVHKSGLYVWRQILNHWTTSKVPGYLIFNFGVGLSLVSGSPFACTDQSVLSCVLGEGRRQKTRYSASLVLLPCPVNSPVSWTLNFLPSTQDAHQVPALFLLSESQPGRSHLVYFLWFMGLCPTLLDGQWHFILAGRGRQIRRTSNPLSLYFQPC